MKYGIYYAYWEKEWGGDFLPYISKVKNLGFDILEIACGDLVNTSDEYCISLKDEASANGIILTGGYGPRPEHDLSSPDEKAVEKALVFYENTFKKMQLAGVESIGGALYSFWPVPDPASRNKSEDLSRSISRMKVLADIAAKYNITLGMESLNRFEGYLINCADECISYVKAVDKPNVKVMLDTFHMNIEEDSIAEAIRSSEGLLGHFHVGEPNRKPPRKSERMPWEEIGKALRDISYDGNVVMEPFVRAGGQVGKDISIWRDISCGASDDVLDADVAASVKYLRSCFE